MGFKLRDYQVDMVEKIYEAWDNGEKNVLLVLPTGLGKTATFCSIAVDKAVKQQNKMVTAIKVHRKELVQQISLTLASLGIHHNIIAPKNVILGIIGAQRRVYGKQFYNYNSPISVVSVDTLNARIGKHEAWAKSVRLWITDEAAHVLETNKWGRAIQYFPEALGLGVTATPKRLDKKGLGRHVDGVFDCMIEGPDVKWGIENGYLSKWKAVVPQSDYELFLRNAGSNADFTAKNMTEAAERSKIKGDVVDNYIKWALGKQAILFAPTISVAEDMESKFLDQGISAKLLTGNSTDKERLDGLIDFQERKINVLLNVDLFDEGLDVPGIECVIMARPTMSLGKYKQMVGRGLRPAPNKSHLLIIDHVGNINRHGYPDKKITWSLDRDVKRKMNVSLMRVCLNPECASPFERALTACPWCGMAVTSNGGGGERVPPEQVDGDLILIDPYTINELERRTILEEPDRVAERVAHTAGTPAAIRARRLQVERIEAQSKLKETIALWAGKKKAEYLSDREIHKTFYLEFGMTIAEALAEPKVKMLAMEKKIEGDIYDSQKKGKTERAKLPEDMAARA